MRYVLFLACVFTVSSLFTFFSIHWQSRSSKKPEIATVIAPYTATSSEQLSLTRGQLIMIRKKSASGWWEGELQVYLLLHRILLCPLFPHPISGKRWKLSSTITTVTYVWWLQAKGRKRQLGWFPASYVKVLSSSGGSSRTTPVPAEMEVDLPRAPPAVSTETEIKAAFDDNEEPTSTGTRLKEKITWTN